MSALRFFPIASVFLPAVLSLPPALAQACPHAIIRIESSQSVDQGAICDAAQPWAAEGYDVFVFLTDVQPASEDAWYSLLDGVEAEAGLRDLTEEDGFNTNAIAFEATTAPVPFGVSLTYGEDFYGTPLDTNDQVLNGVRNALETQLEQNNPTQAFVEGLNLAQQATFAGTAPNATPTPLPEPTLAPDVIADDQGGNGWRSLVGGGLILGGGTAGALSYRRKRLRKNLADLQGQAANLMMLCEDHLAGNHQLGLIPYQRFVTVGGEVYPDMTRQVKAWLQTCRQALDETFALHQQLNDDDSLSLTKQLEAWEGLYMILVGSRDRILNQSEAQLQNLLNPTLTVAETQLASPGLSQKLTQVQQKLQGTPIKATFTLTKPSDQDLEGILGYLEQIEQLINRLRKAPEQAEEKLAQLNQQRQQIAATLPASLNLSTTQVLDSADQQLVEAKTAAEAERYLDTLAIGTQLTASFKTLSRLAPVFDTHDQQQAQIQAWVALGYRPPQLPLTQRVVNKTLESLKERLTTGNYDAAEKTLNQFETNSENAFQTAHQWQQQHQDNIARLGELQSSYDDSVSYLNQTVAPAWQTLQTYPEGNWQDIATALPQATELLNTVARQDLPQLAEFNSLERQDFTAFKRETEATGQRLHQIQQHFTTVTNRLRAIQTAEKRLSHDFVDTTVAIAHVENACTKKLLGLIAVSKPDGRLEVAQQQLSQAQTYLGQREIWAALETQDEARRLLLVVYGDELNARGVQVASLVNQHKARGAGRASLNQAINQIKSEAEIRSTSRQALWQMYHNASQAEQLLAEAKRAANQAIRRYNSSSSHSSYSYRSSNTGFSRSTSSRTRSSSSSSFRSSSSRSSSSRSSSRRSSSSSRGSSRRR
ncbi:MAG: hypothetical protein AAFZ49_01085 [Cyanobacteria bacterium J06659_2]